MEFLIAALAIALFLLWRKLKNIEAEADKVKVAYQDKSDQLKKDLYIAAQEKLVAQKQIDAYKEEIDGLKRAIEEVNKKLDFYKNIEEDSGNLNVSENVEVREALLQKATQQVIADRHQQEEKIETVEVQKKASDSLLDEEQLLACGKMENCNGNLFITGKAGTGKSFLLDVFRKSTHKNLVVLAPTGIAALNVKGVTLHSIFGYYNLVNLDIDAISAEKIRLKSETQKILKQVDTIIIDEISMVRADTFDKIDRILKVINGNDEPFGGKQIILFGDLFQLPPVTKSSEYDYLVDRYGGIYFFCSHAYKQGGFGFIELTINHRQKDDAEYFDLLNRIRVGEATTADIAVLNSRVVQDMSIYDRFTTLLPTKAEVEKTNKLHIDQLDSVEYKFQAKVIYDKYPDGKHNFESVFPIASTLTLKKGALVMMVSNDPDHRWVNGTLGIISRISDNGMAVAIDKKVYEIQPFNFSEEEISYKNGKITYEEILVVRQFPVVPAYAITIHKSQGQTYQNIVCDINRCFANGQAYVALSRCASLRGLHLTKNINGASIRVDRQVLNFYHEQTAKC